MSGLKPMESVSPDRPSKKPDRREALRQAALSGRTAPVSAGSGDEVQAQVPAVKPVRLNLDVDRELHRWLRGFALEADSDASKVVRALLNELKHNPELAAKIRARVSIMLGDE